MERWLPLSPSPVYEVRPEVSFAVLLWTPARAGKKTWAGMVERRKPWKPSGSPWTASAARSRSGVADLDSELFRSTYLPAAVDRVVLAENDRSLPEQLGALGMLELSSGEARVLGMLVVGLDPSGVIPGAYIQFVRYEGNDEASNVVDHEELRGNLVGQLDILARLLTANVRTAVRDVVGLRQEDQADYPIPALRELVLNAVTHRDYEHFHAPVRVLWFDDRVEITSPGGPYGVVTKDTFDRRNDYRNPALAAAMKTLGYVNRFGRGITLVRLALEHNGNPPAEFLVDDTYWSVTVRRAR